jgi:putative ABC transport system permease protein
VASYVAALRTREIGLRIALGATASAVRRLIIAEAATPIAAGIGAGMLLALTASRTIEAFLSGISRFDPVTFVAVPCLLVAVAFAATYLPARRASRIQPVDALRNDQ